MEKSGPAARSPEIGESSADRPGDFRRVPRGILGAAFDSSSVSGTFFGSRFRVEVVVRTARGLEWILFVPGASSSKMATRTESNRAPRPTTLLPNVWTTLPPGEPEFPSTPTSPRQQFALIQLLFGSRSPSQLLLGSSHGSGRARLDSRRVSAVDRTRRPRRESIRGPRAVLTPTSTRKRRQPSLASLREAAAPHRGEESAGTRA